MTKLLFALCAIFSILLAIGQLLFKAAADQIGRTMPADGYWALLSGSLFAALACYGVATILWVYILTKVPLSIAYPFTLAGAVIVIALANVSFGEMISPRQMFGIIVVIVGMAIIYL